MEDTHTYEQKTLDAYETYADDIFRYCLVRLYNRAEARDITQEVFLRTWRYITSGKNIENPRAFLYKVATNLIITTNQKKQPVSLDLLHEEGFDPGVDDHKRMETVSESVRVLQRLDELDSDAAELIRLRYVEDLMPKEIAEVMGTNENVISVRIHRAMKKLQELLGEQ
jgi:RNA polymerase sigma-70 factor (ECF subfamily)